MDGVGSDNEIVRVSRNGAFLQRNGGFAEIHVPYLFANRFVSVPTIDLAVNNPMIAPPSAREADPDLVARTRIAFLPPSRLRALPKALPNLVLLFRHAQALPRFRPSAFLVQMTFGPRRVHGLFVEASDAGAVIEKAAGWGITVLDDPLPWIEHRWASS